MVGTAGDIAPRRYFARADFDPTIRLCPFCGGTLAEKFYGSIVNAIPRVEHVTQDCNWRVICYGCLAMILGNTREDAVAKWNKRAE